MPKLGQTVGALMRHRRDAARPIDDTPGRLVVGEFAPNPGALTMRVYAPPELATDPALVVVLHGCTQTAQTYADGAGWLTLADRFGFVVLCPEQTQANNPNRCFNWFQPGDTRRETGEAASIAAMTRRAIADYAIGPDRVFVTGLSAGGAMTAVMLATYPELFAGGAVIAGLPYGAAASMSEAFGAMMQPKPLSGPAWGDKVRDGSDHEGPWPTISIWHGDADATVRPASADALVAQWTDVHATRPHPSTARTPQGRAFEVWMSDHGTPVVEHHRIPGMGHGTPLRTQGPDGLGTVGPYCLEVGVSSSLEIGLGWGIATAAIDATDAGGIGVHATRPEPATTSGPPGQPTVTLASSSDRATAMIETALRAAGLMR